MTMKKKKGRLGALVSALLLASVVLASVVLSVGCGDDDGGEVVVTPDAVDDVAADTSGDVASDTSDTDDAGEDAVGAPIETVYCIEVRVPGGVFCDGVSNCGDGTDEHVCGEPTFPVELLSDVAYVGEPITFRIQDVDMAFVEVVAAGEVLAHQSVDGDELTVLAPAGNVWTSEGRGERISFRFRTPFALPGSRLSVVVYPTP